MIDPDLLADRYRPLSPLGSGGMGEVWLAEDTLLERRVAVKRLYAGAVPDPIQLARMMREAKLAARLDHPNAVTLHDVVVVDGHPHLIMQYVAGTTLTQLMETGPLPIGDVARIGAQVAQALAGAHEIGIVHRDVKPGNILLDGKGRALLADFGVSRSASDATLTQTGAFLGTPGYLAPEIAQGGMASAASDVYALGATLYAAVEGRPPFDDGSGNHLAVLAQILTRPVPRPVRAGGLTDIIMAMLGPDPVARPPAESVAAHLGRIDAIPSSRVPADEAPTVSVFGDRRGEPDGPGMLTPPGVGSSEPFESLVGALDYSQRLTDGWCGDLEVWQDLVVDEIGPQLRPGDKIDLFVPSLHHLAGPAGAALSRRAARSLTTPRPGVTIVLADRIISAWSAGARVLSATVRFSDVRQVVNDVHADGGEDYHGIAVLTVNGPWPILFSNRADLRFLRYLLTGRLLGTIRPDWDGDRVAHWWVADGQGGWRREAAWPPDD
ncbi:MAG: serine/threonine-protein kinase [Jatrophihabitans sp.]